MLILPVAHVARLGLRKPRFQRPLALPRRRARLALAAAMIGSFLFPSRFRGASGGGAPSKPGYLSQQISAVLQSLSRRSCNHPIHTIVFVAVLASTSYIGLLEGSLFGEAGPAAGASRDIDLHALADGGRRLSLGKETGWKWQRDAASFAMVRSVGTALRGYC